jgi:hypothetical protein
VREAHDYVVRAESEGLAPGEIGPFALVPGVGMDGLEIELGPGGALEVEVRVAPGEDPAGVVVGITRGDSFPQTRRTDEAGIARFERLTPGRWVVLRRDVELIGSSRSTSVWSSSDGEGADPADALEWSCEVFAGRTTTHVLE